MLAALAVAAAASVFAHASDVDTVLARRVALLRSGWDAAGLEADAARLLAGVGPDYTWADVNYTSGCSAQRSNWPAQVRRSVAFSPILTARRTTGTTSVSVRDGRMLRPC